MPTPETTTPKGPNVIRSLRLAEPFYRADVLQRHFPSKYKDGAVEILLEELDSAELWNLIRKSLRESFEVMSDVGTTSS